MNADQMTGSIRSRYGLALGCLVGLVLLCGAAIGSIVYQRHAQQSNSHAIEQAIYAFERLRSDLMIRRDLPSVQAPAPDEMLERLALDFWIVAMRLKDIRTDGGDTAILGTMDATLRAGRERLNHIEYAVSLTYLAESGGDEIAAGLDSLFERSEARVTRLGWWLSAVMIAAPIALICLLAALHILIFNPIMRARIVPAEFLREVFESMRTGMLVLDADGTCVRTNQALGALLEMDESWSPVGNSIVDVITELADRGDYGPRIPPCQPIDHQIYRSPEFEEIYLETPMGSVVSVSVSPRAQGGWVLIYSDITWIKKQTRMLYSAQRELAVSEAKAKRLAKQADAANHSKSAFLASMSHEIRTPMNGIIGMSELICETDLTPDQKSYAETIRQSGEALLVIINDILDFSKIEAGRMSLEVVPFDMISMVEDVLMLVSPKAREKDLELAFNYDLNLPTGYRGDPARLRQILINLVGNAVKFTLRGHVSVTVTGLVEDDRARVQIAVEDTGIGIPEDNLDNVFGEFMQVDQTSSRKFEGTGLGLAITKRLVTMMGGDVQVESTFGVGTVFSVLLPLQVDADVVSHKHPFATDPRNVRVLCVDDIEPNRILLQNHLKDLGMDVFIASSGQEAIDTFTLAFESGRAFELALIDHQLPEMQGIEVAQRLRQIDPALRMILLASLDDDSKRLADERAIFSGKIAKPLKIRQLMQVIDDVLSGTGVQSPVDTQPRTQAGALVSPPVDALPDRSDDQVQLRVLVAEDNRTNRIVVQKMFKDQNVELHFAENGRLAVEMFESLTPDLIFMDVSMPEMDGFEATETIRGIEGRTMARHTPIIALTANAMSGDRERCLSHGMDDYLPKPIRKKQLMAVLDAYRTAIETDRSVHGVKDVAPISAAR